MALYPEARRLVEELAELPEVWDDPIDEVRRRDREALADAPRAPVDHVSDVDADGVPCRLYVPAGATPGALLVHLHGGGFVFGDLEIQDPACRQLANHLGVSVLSVGYRLAPEHKFPAARDDVDRVLSWLGHQAWDRVTGHGDSAGANLALVGALRNPGVFRALVLVYPFLDPTAGFDSYATADGAFPRDRALWFWTQYVDAPADLADPDVAPLRSERLGTLPPTLVVTAEHDPLRDEGEELAARLAGLGVPVTAVRYLGQLHGFWGSIETFPAADALLDQTAGFVRRWA
jgi:acetyl esterase